MGSIKFSNCIYILITLIIASCQSETIENPLSDSPPTMSVVFFDKSSSNKNTNDDKKESFPENLQALQSIIKSHLRKKDDSFIGYFLHENTLGASPFVNQTIEVDYPELKGSGGQTKKRLIAEYEQQIGRKANLTWREVQAAYSQTNEYSSRKYTDIWGSLELISRLVDKASTDTDIQVIFLSDMVESMRGDGRRDLHRTSIRNKDEAEQFARADSEWIQKNLTIDSSSLASVKIDVWFPKSTLGSGDQEYIRYYWEALFKKLGINEVNF